MDLVEFLAKVKAFANDNPIFMAAIVWPIVSGILNSVLRKRTEEERAELRAKHPRYAEFVRIVGALGLDPGKAFEALKNLVLGGPPKGPPSGGAGAVIVGTMAIVLAVGATGCTPEARARLIESVTRELAREIECGIANQDLPNDALIPKCGVSPENRDAFLGAVGTSRAVGADHAIAAANIAKKDAADKCEAAGAFKR